MEMESEIPLETKLALLMYGELAAKRSNLLNDTIAAVESINLVKPFFYLNEINQAEQHFISLQKETLYVERLLHEPEELLSEVLSSQLGPGLHRLIQDEWKELDFRKKLRVFVEFEKYDEGKREALDGNSRVFTLLDHLERRISDKRAVVNLNRATIFSFIAIFISVITLTVVVILHFI